MTEQTKELARQVVEWANRELIDVVDSESDDNESFVLLSFNHRQAYFFSDNYGLSFITLYAHSRRLFCDWTWGDCDKILAFLKGDARTVELGTVDRVCQQQIILNAEAVPMEQLPEGKWRIVAIEVKT